GIFEVLAKGPASVAAVARKLDLSERGTRLLMDACVALELLQKNGEQYENTPEATAFLVPGSPGDLSKAIRYNRNVYSAWGKLPAMVRSGKPVEAPEVHLGRDTKRTRDFVLSMHGRALALGPAVIPHLELEGRKRLLDIGGGPGTFAVMAAAANPGLECVVMDLPAVVAIGEELIAEQGMSERVRTLAGDYHDAVFPQDVDAVNILGVLHQESPEAIRDLFARAFDALEPGGIIHVLDMMTDASHTAPKFSALFAVNMALTTQNGWVFSDEELQGWMESSGFVGFTCAPLPGPLPHWLAKARKPE
ncbi:MAG: methyltransferase, partial [Candidatus Sumerlaeota bacterium]